MRKNDNDRIRIGNRIAELRKAQGLTQLQLSEKTGITRTHLSRIERGQYSVGLDLLQCIAENLGKRVDIV